MSTSKEIPNSSAFIGHRQTRLSRKPCKTNDNRYRQDASYWDIDEALSAHYFTSASFAKWYHSSPLIFSDSIATSSFWTPSPPFILQRNQPQYQTTNPMSYASNNYIIIFFPRRLAHRLGLEPASLSFIVDSSLWSFWLWWLAPFRSVLLFYLGRTPY